MYQNSLPVPVQVIAPSTILQQPQTRHARYLVRLSALMAANMTRLYDHLALAGITHVTVSFHCDYEICRVIDLSAWADDVECPCPDVAMSYVAPILRAAAVRKLALRDAIARIACDLVQDLRAESDIRTFADGHLSIDAVARTNLLDYNPHVAVEPITVQPQAHII